MQRLLPLLPILALLAYSPLRAQECVIFDWAVPPGTWSGSGGPDSSGGLLMTDTTRWVFHLGGCSLASGTCDAFGSGSVAYQDGTERTEWYSTGTVPTVLALDNLVTYAFAVAGASVPYITPRIESLTWVFGAELPATPPDSPSAADLSAASSIAVDIDHTVYLPSAGLTSEWAGSSTTTVFSSCNPPAAALSIDDVTQAEGSGGGNTAFTFTVSRDTNAAEVQVTVDTVDGSATAGSDYTAVSGTVLTFPAGGTLTHTVTVDVAADDVVELDEGLTVELSSPSNATLTDSTGAGTIENDDEATLSIADAEVTEGSGGGTTPLTFTVTLDTAVDVPVSVDFATADGTAEDDSGDGDYIAGQGTLQFDGNAGETETVVVDVIADHRPERDEEFSVDLSGLTASTRSVTLGTFTAAGTILDDDDACPSFDAYRQPFDSPTSPNGHPATSGETVTFENVVDGGGATTTLPPGPVSGVRLWGLGMNGAVPCALDPTVPFDVTFAADDAGAPGIIVAQRIGVLGGLTDAGSGIDQIDLLFTPFDGAGVSWVSVERAAVAGCAFQWLAEETPSTYDDHVFVASGPTPGDAYLCLGDPPFFADGFESGDLRGWSTASN